MEDFAFAREAYAQSTKSIGDARGVEYQVFARVTRDLAAASSGAAADFPKFTAAVHENLRLWTLVASDIARDGNKLPADLRARLFYLYEFTRQHTKKALRGETGVNPLIDVNTAVMRGLKTPPQRTEAA